MIAATYTDGTIDTYQGQRKVTAGWAIFHRETGAIIKSGHSMDAGKAQKTAEGNADYIRATDIGAAHDLHDLPSAANARFAQVARHVLALAKRNGFDGSRPGAALDYLRAQNAQRRADRLSKIRIEVVAITY